MLKVNINNDRMIAVLKLYNVFKVTNKNTRMIDVHLVSFLSKLNKNAYLGTFETSMMNFFAKIVHS